MLRDRREGGADAGPQRSPFPDAPTPDGILAWRAGLQPGRPPDPEGASVEARPSIQKTDRNRKPKPAGVLMRGVASLDPTSIVIAAFLLDGASLLFVYGHRYVARIRYKPDIQRSVKVSEARLCSRYKTLVAT